jgi:hypothetical protein
MSTLGERLFDNIVAHRRREEEREAEEARRREVLRRIEANDFRRYLNQFMYDVVAKIGRGEHDIFVGRGVREFWAMFETHINGHSLSPEVNPLVKKEWGDFCAELRDNGLIVVEGVREAMSVLVFTPKFTPSTVKL